MFLRRALRIFALQSQLCSKSLLTTRLNTISFDRHRHRLRESWLYSTNPQVAGIIDQLVPPHEQENPKIVTVDEWRSSRESFKDDKIFRSMLFELTRRKLYDAAKSYIEMVKKYEPQLLSTSNEVYVLWFLEIYYQGMGFCSNEDDIQYIQDTYTKIRKAVPVLGIFPLKTLILAIQKTPRWRDALELLEEVSMLTEGRTKIYNTFVYNALKENDSTLAWSLIDKMAQLHFSPHDDCWIEWLHYCRRSGITEWNASVCRMLEEFYSHHIQMSCRLAEELKTFIDELCPEYSAEKTLINKDALCVNCKTKLRTKFSSAEHVALKEMVEKIIDQGGSFRSTFAEKQKFIKFIENCLPYNVVIDGLNAIHRRNCDPWDNIRLIKSVLDAKILFLGRIHLLKNATFKKAAEVCQVFLCNNLSQDDAYVLYAAIYHSANVKFVTHDLMRPQIACLAGDSNQNLFLRWQRLNQMKLNKLVIRSYLNEISKTAEGNYHIPCVDRPDKSLTWSPVRPDIWLCVRRRPRSKLEKHTETRPSEEKTTVIKPKTTTVATFADGTTVIDDLVERLYPQTSSTSELADPHGFAQKELFRKMLKLPNEELRLLRALRSRRVYRGKRNFPTWLSKAVNENKANIENVKNDLRKKFNETFDVEGNDSGSQRGSPITGKKKKKDITRL